MKDSQRSGSTNAALEHRPSVGWIELQERGLVEDGKGLRASEREVEVDRAWGKGSRGDLERGVNSES